MALSGSFNNYPVGQFGLYCEWSGVQNQSGNYTDITLHVYLRYYTIEVGSRANSTLSINGVVTTYTTPAIVDYETQEWHNVLLQTKTVRVKHDADGTKTGVKLSASWRFGGTYSGVRVETISTEAVVDLDPITVYSLTINEGYGSKITVNRTSSGYGHTGNLISGDTLYYGDKLKVSFAPAGSHLLAKHTVNGVMFTSGNTYTVAGDVIVYALAQVNAPTISATDANIGSVSTIMIAKGSPSYTYTIEYSMGNAYGVAFEEANETTIPWTVPTSLFEQIPNTRSGTCTLTLKTYDGLQPIGTSTCQITVSTPRTSYPLVSGTVEDINETTIALTGDSKILIRYMSDAKCTINATAKNAATIISKIINNMRVQDGNELVLHGVSDDTFTFVAADSREYATYSTVTPTIVAYRRLTCNPVITRPHPTENKLAMNITGDFYRGSFGVAANTLMLDYRYKELDGMYGEWSPIDGSRIAIGSASYSGSSIMLSGEFDYRKSYMLQVRARDGSGTAVLSTVIKDIFVQRGIPVFDWGENDFNVNVAFTLNGINIFDIIYPVNSYYMSKINVLPDALASIGEWELLQVGIQDVYAWMRLS